MDYKNSSRKRCDPTGLDILLMVEFKNMAAFDGQREKPIRSLTKSSGGEDVQRQGAIKRMEIREDHGQQAYARGHFEVAHRYARWVQGAEGSDQRSQARRREASQLSVKGYLLIV